MKRLFFFSIVIVFGCAHVCGALGEESPVPMSFTFTDADLVSQDMEFLRKLVGNVKEQGCISIRDNVRLRSTIERLINNKMLGLTAAERQTLVKKTIGEDGYSALERVFMKMLGSSDTAQQRSALRSLGHPMFALESVDEVKTFVFHRDRMVQLMAVKALVYLDVEGADHLLYNVVLCGLLSDYDTASAIDALYISNNKELHRVAPVLVKMQAGARTFKSLLPVLKKRNDYHQIIAGVFKSNMFYVPDKEELTLAEQSKVGVERDLLDEIFANTALFIADETIKKKVMMYANGHNDRLNTMALLMMEKSGQELKYFTEMLQDTQLTATKKRTLELIVSRIQKGERLK